jgi:protein phosphatase
MAAIGTGDERRLRELATRLRAEEAECFIAQHEGARPQLYAAAFTMSGIIYTRTGRRFFNDRELERAVLDRLISALTTAEFWERFQSAWFCLDRERMPWSVKAEDLLRTQYAPTGAAASAAVDAVRTELRQADHRAGCQRVHSCLRRARQSIIPSP